MVLGVDGQMVLLRVGRDPPGHRPADEDAVALQPQVPVQARGVVLLHDEAGLPPSSSGTGSAPDGSGVAPKSRISW